MCEEDSVTIRTRAYIPGLYKLFDAARVNARDHAVRTEQWINENKEVTSDVTSIRISDYKSFEKKELVKNKKEIDENINKNDFSVIDARSRERF